MVRRILFNIIIFLFFWFTGYCAGGGFAHNNIMPLWIVIFSLIGVFVSGIFYGLNEYLKKEEEEFIDALAEYSIDHLKSDSRKTLSYKEFEKKYMKGNK